MTTSESKRPLRCFLVLRNRDDFVEHVDAVHHVEGERHLPLGRVRENQMPPRQASKPCRLR